MNDTNQQDDWQRQVDTISIQLNQLTTEPDTKPQDLTDSDDNEPPQESYYQLLRDAPDNYLSDNTRTTQSQTNSSPENHHTTTLPCNEQKQPLLDENISNHIQFDLTTNEICHTYHFQLL